MLRNLLPPASAGYTSFSPSSHRLRFWLNKRKELNERVEPRYPIRAVTLRKLPVHRPIGILAIFMPRKMTSSRGMSITMNSSTPKISIGNFSDSRKPMILSGMAVMYDIGLAVNLLISTLVMLTALKLVILCVMFA